VTSVTPLDGRYPVPVDLEQVLRGRHPQRPAQVAGLEGDQPVVPAAGLAGGGRAAPEEGAAAGASYGAYLGATYANLFPGKVRALVLDAAVDPVAWATGHGDRARTRPLFDRMGSARGTYATLLEFFRLCDRGACAFSGGDPRRRYAELARRLLTRPAQTPDGPVTYATLVALTFKALQDPAEWPRLAETLQQLDSLTSPAARAPAAQPAPPAPNGGTAGLPQRPGRPPRRGLLRQRQPGQRRRLEAGRGRGRPRRALLRPLLDLAVQHLPAVARTRPGPLHRPWTRPTANPVLVVGNRFDPTAPYQGAVTLARLLPRSRLLTLDGWGHTSEGKSSCVDAHTSRYLLTTRVPPPGTVCRPDHVPFARPRRS
jgi:pimeloyl-ACP methyl ester carboxylesterase